MTEGIGRTNGPQWQSIPARDAQDNTGTGTTLGAPQPPPPPPQPPRNHAVPPYAIHESPYATGRVPLPPPPPNPARVEDSDSEEEFGMDLEAFFSLPNKPEESCGSDRLVTSMVLQSVMLNKAPPWEKPAFDGATEELVNLQKASQRDVHSDFRVIASEMARLNARMQELVEMQATKRVPQKEIDQEMERITRNIRELSVTFGQAYQAHQERQAASATEPNKGAEVTQSEGMFAWLASLVGYTSGDATTQEKQELALSLVQSMSEMDRAAQTLIVTSSKPRKEDQLLDTVLDAPPQQPTWWQWFWGSTQT